MPKKAPGKSERTGLTVLQLFQMFPDEAASRKWLEDIRWPDGERFCPHCGSLKTTAVRNETPMPYHCGECRQYFSVKTGTVMQSSKVALQKWVIAMYLMSTSLKGVSSMKLHRDLGVTQKTAWLLAQKIRQGWIDGSDKLAGKVEVDETYVGGKERNKHRNKRLNAGRGAVGKTAVIGAKARNGKVKVAVIEKTDAATLEGFILDSVQKGATVFTDEHRGYSGLSKSFVHQSVKHSVGEYVNGMAHTNGIESFWATEQSHRRQRRERDDRTAHGTDVVVANAAAHRMATDIPGGGVADDARPAFARHCIPDSGEGVWRAQSSSKD